jgi:hypothetical protein
MKTYLSIIIAIFFSSCATRLEVLDKPSNLNHETGGKTYYQGKLFTGIAVYYQDGDKSKKIYENEYVDGVLNGRCRWWFGGRLKSSGIYKDGKEWDGTFYEHAVPMVFIITHYKKGKIVLYTDWDTGKPLDGEYRGSGKYSGSAKYYKNGALVKIEKGFQTIWEKGKKANKENPE